LFRFTGKLSRKCTDFLLYSCPTTCIASPLSMAPKTECICANWYSYVKKSLPPWEHSSCKDSLLVLHVLALGLDTHIKMNPPKKTQCSESLLCPAWSSFLSHELLATTDQHGLHSLSFVQCPGIGILQKAAFSDWLLSPSHLYWSVLHVFLWLYRSFPLSLSNIPLSGCFTVSLPAYLWKDILVISRFGQLWIKFLELLCAGFCEIPSFPCLWSIPRDAIAREEAKSVLSFVRNPQTVVSVVPPLHSPASNEWEFLVFHRLPGICCCPWFGFWQF
jgi:hypothetical protein